MRNAFYLVTVAICSDNASERSSDPDVDAGWSYLLALTTSNSIATAITTPLGTSVASRHVQLLEEGWPDVAKDGPQDFQQKQ